MFWGCTTTCPCRDHGPVGPAGVLRFYDLPMVEACSADVPAKTVFLSLALGFYGEGVGRELMRRQVSVSETVRAAVAPFRAAELNSVEGYERLRREIVIRVNGFLSSGRVERVVIRGIAVR